MKLTIIGGNVTYVVEDTDTEQDMLKFVAELRDDHPPYPFAIIADRGCTVVFRNDDELDYYIDGWGEGVTVDA